MGTIVVAAAASHSPGIAIARGEPDPEPAGRFYAGMDRIAQAFREAAPDVIVTVTSEHFANFYLDNVPAICVGTGRSARGPAEVWLGPEVDVPGDRPTATALLRGVMDRGFDPAFSEDLVLDHGTWVPLQLVNPGVAVPVVPVVINNMFEPMPSPRRIYDFGRALGAAIAALPDRRIALLATGGLSHKVGTPDAGDVDPVWDHRFLEGIAGGDAERLAALTHEELGGIGNGTHEVRNWLCVMGAVGAVPAEVVAYEPMTYPSWATGCGAVIWGVAGTEPEPDQRSAA